MPHICGMDAAYENAMRTLADCYEQEVEIFGGRSLARVATIVVNNGAFFTRLRDGKPFLVHNLERFASWFRDPANWPNQSIPHAAAAALNSIGRPPVSSMTHEYREDAASVACDRNAVLHQEARHG